jgi:urea transport system permease protein
MRRLAALLLLLIACAAPAAAADDELAARIKALALGDFAEREQAINALAELGDGRAARALEALSAGKLYARKADGQVFIAERDGRDYTLTDPITGADAGTAGRREVDKIRVNNAIRGLISAVAGALTLMSPDPLARAEAADAVFKSGDASAIPGLDKAIARETDPTLKQALVEARAVAVLLSDAAEADKLAAVEVLVERGDREAQAKLSQAALAGDGAVPTAAAEGVERIEQALLLWDVVQNIWYGISLGSVLLLAAIGLAITFGVMGVINMAHGEMVMLGAYTTFVVQDICRTSFPHLFDYSLFFAVPAAFVVAGGFGVALERGVIRWLYGRPLETLLATWGLSLILQQMVRSIFGPTNREVGTPSWMSGTVELGPLLLTSNRIAIVVFAALVFVALLLVIKFTSFGLQMRAVTQNRRMANAVGIRSAWVDAMTFGLGSAIAGMAGVALSQIDNVSPNLGQSYIIDSFLVVVFGGVGNLWGTLFGALSLGIANKFLEPYAGAVLGKILILVAVILFIQKRPRGLFALKGRAVEA